MQAEHKVHWFRRSQLPYCRVVDLPPMDELHVHSLEWCEILGVTLDREMRPLRAFYLCHKQPDGFGPFVPDIYHGKPVAIHGLQANEPGFPANFSKAPDKRTAAIEARIHRDEVAYWESWEAAHALATAPAPAPKKKWSLFR